MRSLPLALLVTLSVAAASPAAALTFDADALVTPQSGDSLVLSGSLEVDVILPASGNVAFDVTALSLSGGGLTIGLASPGLGVLNPDGDFLIPNLFLTVTQAGPTQALTVNDVEGSVLFAPGGGDLLALQSGFFLTLDGAPLVVSVNAVRRVPEPALATLFATAALFAARRLRRG